MSVMLWIFQFTPLREGRRPVEGKHLAARPDFNSRPSARGDASLFARGLHWPISIHAPPRGATRDARGQRHVRRYFNSRPSARGDKKKTREFCKSVEFQFTPLREGRRNPAERRNTHGQISIHAPPRGATWQCPADRRWTYFNSRPSARGDDINLHAIFPILISIHAPPRGATQYDGGCDLPDVFQFTPLREGRPFPCPAPRRRCHFNSRPSARGDGGAGRIAGPTSKDFNSRPSARGDAGDWQSRARQHYISIHAPPRGATWKMCTSMKP